MNLPSFNVDAIQKLSKVSHFLFVVSVLLFTDAFLMLFAGVSFPGMPEQWVKNDLTVMGGVYFIILAGLYFAILIPTFIWMHTQLLTMLGLDEGHKSLKDGWFSIGLLREYAVMENEQTSYIEYQRLQAAHQETKLIDLCCFSLVMLVPLDWYLSTEGMTSLVAFLYQQIELLNGLVATTFNAIGLFAMFGIGQIAFRRTRPCDEYECDFEMASKLEKWCREKRNQARRERTQFEAESA